MDKQQQRPLPESTHTSSNSISIRPFYHWTLNTPTVKVAWIKLYGISTTYLTVQQSYPIWNSINITNQKKSANEKWFDTDCRHLRKTMRNWSNQKRRQPDNHELCIQYWETLKIYRRTLRTKRVQHVQHQLNEIEDLTWLEWFLEKMANNQQTIQRRTGYTKWCNLETTLRKPV